MRFRSMLSPAWSLPAVGQDPPHQPVPTGMSAFELSSCPSVQIAQPKRDGGRSADSHVAVEDDPIDVRPFVDERDNVPGVLLGEEDVGGIAALGDVVELEA